MRAIACLLLVIASVAYSQTICDTVSANCTTVQSLTGLQNCVLAASSCDAQVSSFCGDCQLVTDTEGPDFNMANPVVAQCIYNYARTCQRNVDIGSTSFTCIAPTAQTPTPCADMFANYSNTDALVASEQYPACVSVANANCLGFASHAWCGRGGTSLAQSNIVRFLEALQRSCGFRFRAVRGAFVAPTASVDPETVEAQLLLDLQALTATSPAQGLFAAGGVESADGSTTVHIDLLTGVPSHAVPDVVNYLNGLFANPTSGLYAANRTVTRVLTSMSFTNNFPFSASSGDELTSAQKGGVVAGVLIFIVAVLVVYNIFARKTKGDQQGEESESDEDDEDDAAIHARNQQRIRDQQKQEDAQRAQAQGQHQPVPVQNQDQAISAWS